MKKDFTSAVSGAVVPVEILTIEDCLDNAGRNLLPPHIIVARAAGHSLANLSNVMSNFKNGHEVFMKVLNERKNTTKEQQTGKYPTFSFYASAPKAASNVLSDTFNFEDLIFEYPKFFKETPKLIIEEFGDVIWSTPYFIERREILLDVEPVPNSQNSFFLFILKKGKKNTFETIITKRMKVIQNEVKKWIDVKDESAAVLEFKDRLEKTFFVAHRFLNNPRNFFKHLAGLHQQCLEIISE